MKRLFAVAAMVMALFMAAPVPRGEAAQVKEPSVGQLEVQLNPKLVQAFKSLGISIPEWNFVCTATQVKPGIVLSASHCIIDDTFHVYEGYVGSYEYRYAPKWSKAMQWSLPVLVKTLTDYQPAPGMPSDTTCTSWGSCYTEHPVVVGYRIGFPRGNLNNLQYRSLDVKFSGFRLTDDSSYPQYKTIGVKTDPTNPLYQADVSVLTLSSNERHKETYPAVFGLKLANIPHPGDLVDSVGYSLGFRQWSGKAWVREPLTYLDGYGWVIPLEHLLSDWGPGASGSVVFNDDREIVGILTLGGVPGMLDNFTGVVPPGVVKMALERAGVL